MEFAVSPSTSRSHSTQHHDRTFASISNKSRRVRLTERKHEILRQFLDAIIKHFVPVFEVQFHIPSVFPQSQQVDGNL
ncbi:hypothetical protein QUA90_30100 [Microcoleus sp. D3_18_C4]